MVQLAYSAQARADIAEIWDDVATERGDIFADSVVDRLTRRAEALQEHPLMGPARRDIDPEARVLVTSRWLILYRIVGDVVQVVRVVDGARDLRKIAFANFS